ncbi:DUF411 domain-containing protein [Halomonas sp. I5-271120]|uniref:DUF411 domain-containing protein n=1 Tax=Halomonas sp. I5-271120 TaxID=3061632 RepID=UPI00271542F7|nr:DUF411 domain-containing protein [Halomonas sp. I5-271120]
MTRLLKTLTLIGLLTGTGTVQADDHLPDKAVMFKTPNCGCCAGHAKHLEEQGIDVRVIHASPAQMAKTKAKAGVPHDARSCHTIAMGGYAIEGHVPTPAMKKLFKEKPDIDGIALAGMPTGTPGMPGPKEGPFKVKSFNGGTLSAFGDF